MLTRKDFPIFTTHKDLIYFDSGATSQIPKEILNEQIKWYENYNANPHRGLYGLSVWATNEYENARQSIANSFEVKPSETVFVRNTTEGLNLIALGYKKYLKRGDSIVISQLEHHSNILPWVQLAKETGSVLKVIKTVNGRISTDHAEQIIDKRTKIVSISHISNVFGTIQPLKKIAEIARRTDSIVIVDGAQAATHLKIQPWKLGADAYVFSGHKVYAPNGIAVVFIQEQLSQKLDHYLLGGDMVDSVNGLDYKLKSAPWRFEAGTPNSSGAVCLAKALTLLHSDYDNNKNKLDNLKNMIYRVLVSSNSKIYSPSDLDIPLISFDLVNIDADKLAIFLDDNNIAIRSGFLCAQPIVEKLNIRGVARISAGLWNEVSDVQALKTSLKQLS